MIKILVVEDDVQILKFCTDALSRLGERIVPIPVVSAEEALDVFAKNRIDGAIVDIILPGMNGFSLVSRIRDMDEYCVLPVVFATGEDKDVPDTYKEYHNIDYISKPYGLETFNAAVSRLLKEIDKQKKMLFQKGEREIPFAYDSGRAVITFSEILYATTMPGRRIKLVTRKQEYIRSNVTLCNIITEINEKEFVLCHRACAVNVQNIQNIEVFFKRSWTIYFKDAPGISCELSKKYRSAIYQLLNEKLLLYEEDKAKNA